jgi:hypothetical protein
MASLTPVANCEAFVEALQKSGLLAAEELAKVRETAAEASDPKALARELIKAGTLTKWQAAQLLHGFYLLVVGKFKLLDQLSSGETGRVYLAEHMQIQRRHALKILSRRHASKPDVLKRFLAEAQQVCALDHRNLSHVYDVNQDGDKYYLVMENVEGQSVQQRVEATGPLSPAEATEVIHQAADGLAHAHEHQVVHGDLKPANLVVDPSGIVNVMDIGQSRLFDAPAASASTDETTEAAALSAAIYRAPELRSAGGTASERSDIYSLGSVLCYLLAGKPAADASDATKLLARLKELPAEVQKLCLRMMADDPAARPVSMNDVRTAIASLGKQPAGEPTTVPDAGATEASPAAAEGAAPPKKKRRLIAKAINEAVEAAEAAKSAEAATTNVAEEAAPNDSKRDEPADPFAGFAVQTGKKRVAKGSGPSPVAAGTIPTASTKPVASANQSKLPLIVGGAIGGGVLLIGGIVVAVVLALNWGKGVADKAVADAKNAVKKVADDTTSTSTGAESNPGESNPAEANPAEANPTPVAPEATPNPPATGGNPLTPPAANPLTPPAVTPVPMPMPAPPAVTPLPETSVTPTPTPTPEPAATATTEPMPAPIQPLPVEPMVEPVKPAVVGNPFEGLVASINLPKLEPMMAEPPADALAPLVLGPCKVDEKGLVFISLRGGEGAIRGGKQMFELAAAQDGTALRDWEIKLSGGSGPPVLVALLSVQNQQLSFQWTPEGAKQVSAPLLGNCALQMTAGAGKHDLALRVPILAEPLKLEMQKSGASVKWTIPHLPDPKNIFIQITRLDGEFLEHKFKERDTLEGSDRTEVWTGSGPDSMVLGLRLDSTIAAQSIQVKGAPLYQIKGMRTPKAVASKKELTAMNITLDKSRQAANAKHEIASKAKGEQAERAVNLAKVELDNVNATAAQVEELEKLIEGLDGKGAIHFRVFFQTADGPIDLLVTEEGVPAAKEEPPAPAPGM